MKEKFNTKDLYLAELKYAAKEKGIEVMEPLSYVFVYHKDNSFYNVITKEEYPTYEKIPYSNTTIDGEDYGTKIRLVSELDETGPCYLLSNIKCEKLLSDSVVDLEIIKDYILNSSFFFKDRIDIAVDRLANFKEPVKMFKIFWNEFDRREYIKKYFKEKEVGKQKVKQWK